MNIIEQNNEKIKGQLSGFDRIIINGFNRQLNNYRQFLFYLIQNNSDLWINFSLNLNCSQIYAFSLIDYLFPMSNLFLIKVVLMSKFLSEISEMSFSKE